MSELPSPRAGRAELRDDIRARARDLPGVYGILGRDGGLIYVGKSVRVRTRLLSYFRAKEGEKAHRVIEEAERAEWDYTPDEFSALITEMKLIQRHRPRFNVQHKRKRNYAFVKITREPAPRVLPVSRVTEDGSIYYGPFPRVETLKDAVRELVHTLGIRDCTAAMPLHYADQRDIFAWEPSPMCIRAELRTCLAPCCGRPSESRYREAVRAAMHFLEGASTRPLEKLRDAMLAAADREEVLDDLGRLVGAVRVQPVIAQPDAPADADPVQRRGHDHRLPRGVEQRHHRQCVEDDERGGGHPADLVSAREIDVPGGHGSSFGERSGPQRPDRRSA